MCNNLMTTAIKILITMVTLANTLASVPLLSAGNSPSSIKAPNAPNHHNNNDNNEPYAAQEAMQCTIICKTCTLLNYAFETHCTSCQQPLYNEVKAVPEKVKIAPEIECPNCQSINKNREVVCKNRNCKMLLPNEYGFWD